MSPPTYSLACPTPISGIYHAAALCPKAGNFLHVLAVWIITTSDSSASQVAE